jgi:hypothetical protein
VHTLYCTDIAGGYGENKKQSLSTQRRKQYIPIRNLYDILLEGIPPPEGKG